MSVWSTVGRWLRARERSRQQVGARSRSRRYAPGLELLEGRCVPAVSLTGVAGGPVTLGSGAVLTDSATLSGGTSPSGYLLFTLAAPNGNTVDAEIVAVNGNGSYNTPHGYLPTVSGTFQWNVSYSGDSNNSAASDDNDPAEQATVTAALPTVTGSPAATTVTLATPAPTLLDSATLAGGVAATGTVTFTLYQGTTLLDTETATVDGNGTYTTPTGYSLPTTGTVTGTYQWDVAYNGDSNNTAVSDNNDPAEVVTVTAAKPTLTDTAGGTVLLGSGNSLTDSATLAGGVNPGGYLLFTLTAPNGNIVDTEVVAVSGNGSYATPTGYLPPANSPTGSYAWTASYSGDANNNSADSPADSAPELLNLASPTLTASPTASTITLGTTAPTLLDAATLTGGASETGSLTFTLYANGGNAPVDTETTAVNGDGTYTTPTGYTLPTTGTVIGTYQWDVRYSGDISNTPTSDVNAANELVAVDAASPTLTASPSPSSVTLPGSAPMLLDSATLTGGYFETGTLTFTLYQGSTLLGSVSATVDGDGTYDTPEAYPLPSTGTATGTYQWDVAYTGDGNNTAMSDNNDVGEQVPVNAARPTLTASPGAATLTLAATSPPTLTDAATLTGGYYETGTLTFTLFANGGSTPVDTETAPVNGDGTYTTPTGYTLPRTGTVAGTYQWDVAYSGDTNNNAVSDTNAVAEQVTVTTASPTLTASPGAATVTLTATALPTLGDVATLTSGYFPTGTLTFTLFANGGSTPVDTETVTVAGNGTYITPTGYTLPTTGTVVGLYQWNVAYSGDANNTAVSDTSATGEQVTVAAASPALTTEPSATALTLATTAPTLADAAELAGGYFATGTLTFTLYRGTTLLDTETATVNGNGVYQTPTGYTLPTTGAVTGTYQWDVAYSGNANNPAVSDNSDVKEQVTVTAASPTLVTSPGTTSITLSDTAAPMLADAATVENGYFPTGTLTFTLYANGGSTPVDTETVPVTGNGTYITPTGYTLPTTGTVTGTYQWDVAFSGNANNPAVSDNNDVKEQVTVTAASPTLAASPGVTSITLTPTAPTPILADAAAIANGYFPTGTLTFTLFAGGGSTPVDTETVPVAGDGTYVTPTGYTLPATGSVTGTYQWDVAYSGAANNAAVTDRNAVDEQVTVSPAVPTVKSTPGAAVLFASGANLTDSATLAGGVRPSGLLLFTLTSPNGATLDREAVAVTGNGTYTTPYGYLPTTTGVYQWQVSYSGDANNQAVQTTAGAAPQAVLAVNTPTLTVSADSPIVVGTSARLNDSVTLTGSLNATGTLTFYLFAPGVKPSSTDSNSSYSDTVTVDNDGIYTTAVGTNKGGFLPSTAGTYTWVVSYNGDNNNNAVKATGTAVVSPATPELASTQASRAVVLGSRSNLTDSVALSGGDHPGGDLVFTLKSPRGSVLDTEVVTVAGDGTYSTPTSVVPGTIGTYVWTASYSGDPNNTVTRQSATASEKVVNTATLTVKAGSTVVLGSKSKLTEAATIAGGVTPGGTITFFLFAPGVTPNATDSNYVDTVTVTVKGDGKYTASFTPTAIGTYTWLASYSGDDNNQAVASAASAELVKSAAH